MSGIGSFSSRSRSSNFTASQSPDEKGNEHSANATKKSALLSRKESPEDIIEEKAESPQMLAQPSNGRALATSLGAGLSPHQSADSMRSLNLRQRARSAPNPSAKDTDALAHSSSPHQLTSSHQKTSRQESLDVTAKISKGSPMRPASIAGEEEAHQRATEEIQHQSASIYEQHSGQILSSVKVNQLVPASWPTAHWDPVRLANHWHGKKRGPARATPHHKEFEVLTDFSIKSQDDFKRFSQAFMSPNQPRRDHVIERMSASGSHILRYDFKLNLYGSIDKSTGEIGTVFRPGYLVGKGPFPARLESFILGFRYFKRYAETGKGDPNRGKK